MVSTAGVLEARSRQTIGFGLFGKDSRSPDFVDALVLDRATSLGWQSLAAVEGVYVAETEKAPDSRIQVVLRPY